MGVPYAELVGDPVAHSKSPLIHTFWLEKLGLKGDYRTVRMSSGAFRAYLESRRRDPWWRGCNVTRPLKQEAAALVGDPTHVCAWLEAVNAILPSPLDCLIGANTDVAGVAASLFDVELEGETACLVGTGGAARAALCYLVQRRVRLVSIVSRDPRKAEKLRRLLPRSVETKLAPEPFARPVGAAAGAKLIINATPMGMRDGPLMHREILDRLERDAATGVTVLDMVYDPPDTLFLRTARGRGASCVDGLAMLIGQAAPAFELFFGAPPPRGHDAELRARLAA